MNSEGAPFWIAGRLLENACKFDKWLLTRVQDKENVEDVEMLQYVERRITDKQKGKYTARHRSVRSYRKSMDRLMYNLQGYLREDLKKKLYLEDTKIVNDFIAFRMSSQISTPNDWNMAVWGKRYISRHYSRLIEIADLDKSEVVAGGYNSERLMRRVPEWYFILGEKLWFIYCENQQLEGFGKLAKALWSDAVLMNLRMQVLEFVQFLTDEQREQFGDRYKELPLEMLSLEEESAFAMHGKKWEKIWSNLLKGQHESDIKYLTHLGWIGIFGILLEIDCSGDVIYPLGETRRIQAIHALREIAVKLSPVIKDEEMEFPYEGMAGFINSWTPENMLHLIQCLNQIDDALQFHVENMKTEFFTMKTGKKQIEVRVEGEVFKKPSYFVTYSKKEDGGLDTFEKNKDDKEQFCFSCTKKAGKTLGISILAGDFGETLQTWKERNTHRENEVSDSNETDLINNEIYHKEADSIEKGLFGIGKTDPTAHKSETDEFDNREEDADCSKDCGISDNNELKKRLEICILLIGKNVKKHFGNWIV